MNVLILGGNSQRHYEWIRQLGTYLEVQGHVVRLHDYAHWKTDVPIANIDEELRILTTELADFDEYVIVAKSIGTVITALGVARGILKPTKCVLLGIPMDGIAGKTNDFLPSLAALPATIIMQNENDPYGQASTVKDWISDVKDIRFVVVPSNDTHDYLDFALIEHDITT